MFQTTTETSLIYGILEPPLIPGQEYAFRVRAKDTNGKDLFKNSGYSAVCTFKFGDVAAVAAPEGMNVYVEGERRAKVTWYTSLGIDRYRVEYRKKPTGPALAWFTVETQKDNVLINDLEPGTDYEVRVVGILRNITSSYTDTKTFRTTPPRVFACGQQVANISPANTKPLITAMAGQVWKVGQFEMEVVQVRGGDGTFTGLGAVIVPYLGFRVYGTFDKIKVNEGQEVIVGEVKALSEGMEAFKKRWEKDVPKVETGTGGTGANGAQPFTGVPISFTGVIDSVYVNKQGEIVAIVDKGNGKTEEQVVPTQKGKNNRITDNAGNLYVVSKEGKVDKMPSTPNAPSAQPKQVDVSKLDDFEKLVKEVIDSVYKIKSAERDTLNKAKEKELKELNKNVDIMKEVNSQAEAGETEFDVDIPQVITNLNLLDSLVEEKKIGINKINTNLNKLNDYLTNIKSISTEAKSVDDYSNIVAVTERRRKIYVFIENKLKK